MPGVALSDQEQAVCLFRQAGAIQTSNPKAAEAMLRQVLLKLEKLGDVRSIAVTQGKIADILKARGQLDEALRIRTELQLPVYEKLGDVRARAITQGKIADILKARGQLDEALCILTDLLTDQLSVWEKLGDMRSIVVTLGKIADIRKARG
jgi:phosphopentomutase